MKHPLSFNPDKFDFLKIYESIKHFYPIGISKEYSVVYNNYPGLKELTDIIVERIHNDINFKETWVAFDKEIESELNKEVVGTTYGQAPSFSSYVLLDDTRVADMKRTKELHFFVSVVGPYYTVVGTETYAVKMEGSEYRSTAYLVVSPIADFSEAFGLLCDKIEQRFKNYRFIPFAICKQTVEGLDVGYSDEHLNAIFHALFNNHVDLDTQNIVGDEHYKMTDWINPEYDNTGGGWTSYPPEINNLKEH